MSVSCDGFTSVLARPIATVVKYSSTYPYPVFKGSTVLAGSTSGATLKSLLQANTEYFLAVSGANFSAYGDTAITLQIFSRDLSGNAAENKEE